MIKTKAWLWAGLILLIQTGCSTTSYIQKASDSNAWKQTRNELEQIHHWDIRGKISIRADADLYTADLYWQQQNQQLNMRLLAPFSQGVTQFTGNDQAGYLVTTEKGEQFDVDSPETVTENAFGVTLPFTELKSWIKGLPDRDNYVWKAEFNEQNRLTGFQQSGWNVKLLKYKKVGQQTLPTKLFLSRISEDMADKNIEVRLIIRRWALNKTN